MPESVGSRVSHPTLRFLDGINPRSSGHIRLAVLAGHTHKKKSGPLIRRLSATHLAESRDTLILQAEQAMAKYRLFLALFLLSKVHGALRRGTSELTSSHLETVNVEAPQATRRLETSYFKPLSCNDNMAPCVPWTSMYGAGMTKHVRLVIPCGICVYMDLPGDTLTLEDGMDVRGRLEIRNDYKITIVSPMIVVQGSLLVWSSWKVRGTPRVKFILDGRANQYFTPIDENRNVCEGRDCEVGPRSFTVAGGKVNCEY